MAGDDKEKEPVEVTYEVQGHWRRTASGQVVWVQGYKKGKLNGA